MVQPVPVRWHPFSRGKGVLPPISRFDPEDFRPKLKTQLLVLQASPFCNINCDYCYLPDRDAKVRMSMETVRLAARRLVENELTGYSLTVVWHAGEPLTVPPSYYDAAIAIVAEEVGQSCTVTHSFQTNGTLISDNWCSFFARHRTSIGVSVDGPSDLHDRHRRTRDGKGTHSRVLAGIERLRANKIPFHVIAVLTKDSLSRSREIYEFFLGIDATEVGMNFDEAEGINRVSTLKGQGEAHQAFLRETLAYSLTSRGRYRVRELANALRLISGDQSTYLYRGLEWPQNGQTIPFNIITVGWNGDFCTFSPELLGQTSAQYANFVLGNVATVGYFDATAGEIFNKLWGDVQRGVRQCKSGCAYFDFCGGGAPSNKYYENGSLDSAETLYCQAMIKHPFDTVLNALEAKAFDVKDDSSL